MTVSVESIFSLAIVAILWGVTNPLLKKGASGLENVKANSMYGQFFQEVLFLVTNAKYMIPFLLNQCGSLLYFLTLQNVDLSFAVPISNSLTFEITAITGWILGEKRADKYTFFGIILILVGVTLCCWDQLNNNEVSS